MLKIISYLLVGAIAAALYGEFLDAKHGAEIADLKLNYSDEKSNARAADLVTLKAAEARANLLTGKLQKTELALNLKTVEVRRALQSQTTGRTCLSAGAVSVLNNAISADGSANMPTPAPEHAGAGTAVATDTDVAEWANNAREKYAVCRARLDTLIDFHTPAEPHP